MINKKKNWNCVIILQLWNKIYKHFNLWSIKRSLQKVTSCLRGFLSDSCHYVCWLIAHTNIYSPLSGIFECARLKTLYSVIRHGVSWFPEMFVTGFHDTDSRCHVTRVIYNLHWGIGHCPVSSIASKVDCCTFQNYYCTRTTTSLSRCLLLVLTLFCPGWGYLNI